MAADSVLLPVKWMHELRCFEFVVAYDVIEQVL